MTSVVYYFIQYGLKNNLEIHDHDIGKNSTIHKQKEWNKKNLLPVNCKKIHEHTIQVHKVRDKWCDKQAPNP